jgi:hypothetical protein
MSVRTRGLDIKAGASKLKADKAARLEAELVIDRWNRRLATGRGVLWSPPRCSPGRHFAQMLVSVIRPGVRAGGKAIPTGQPNGRVLCLAHGGAL